MPIFTGITLNAANPRVTLVDRSSERLMHVRRIDAFHKERLVTARFEQRSHIVIRGTRKCRRPCDFVTVQMQDRKHRTITRRVEILNALP